MTILDSKSLKAILPEQFAGRIVEKAKTTSTVARLSASEPMLFGNVNYVTFNDTVRAEFVEEKGNKSSTAAEWAKVPAVPHKSQVTVRVTEEFMWLDEDYQAQIIDVRAAWMGPEI